MFNQLVYLNDPIYEREFVRSETDCKEPRNVKIFILQYAKLRILELYYNFFDK